MEVLAALNVDISEVLKRKFKSFCADNRITLGRAVTEAIENWMESIEMGRTEKIFSRVSPELAKDLDVTAATRRIKRTDAIEQAIEQWVAVNSDEKHKESVPSMTETAIESTRQWDLVPTRLDVAVLLKVLASKEFLALYERINSHSDPAQHGHGDGEQVGATGSDEELRELEDATARTGEAGARISAELGKIEEVGEEERGGKAAGAKPPRKRGRA